MRTVRITAGLTERLVAFLKRWPGDRSPLYDRDISELERALKVKPATRIARKRRETKRKAKAVVTTSIYSVVKARCRGFCEACGRPFSASAPMELDHFFGRGRGEKSTPRTCWMLCNPCHVAKTNNHPSASKWLEEFAAHARKNGFTAEEDRATGRLDAEKILKAVETARGGKTVEQLSYEYEPAEATKRAGLTTVVNLRREEHDVYIGRKGRGEDGYFGNPFTVQQHGLKALDLYREHFAKRIREDAEFRGRVLELRGKRLGCFCKPGPCHGDVIAEWVNAQTQGEG